MNTEKYIFTQEDKKFMELAFMLAQKGRGTTNPNPVVGAVIVKDGNIISTGYHKMAGTAHAEINAINAVREIPEGAKMYVTLEPCCFYGKTPPCVEAIIKHRFSEVVISSLDPNQRVNGKGVEILKKAGIIVKTGLFEEKAKEQNEIFFKQINLGRPFICVKIASTVDGKIAAASGDSKWITGADSRRFVQKLRFEYGCVLTGINTVNKDNPLLFPRKIISKKLALDNLTDIKSNIATKRIIIKDLNRNTESTYIYSKFFRVVLDSNLMIDINSNLIKTSGLVKTVIFIYKKLLNKKEFILKINQLKLMGVDIVPVGLNDINNLDSKNLGNKDNRSIALNENYYSENKYLNLKEIFNYLYNKYEITSVLVEAGPTIITSLLKEKLIDKFLIFLAPKIIGSGSSYNMFSDLNINNMSDCINLKFKKVKKIRDDFLLEAYPVYT
jgi:diaminohydroxyphosphoribosylaminopyrimidine deaminase / 5-amino-6-(5-phosphoribosylamino)uracil reductase